MESQERLPPHYHRNFIALAGDYIFFLAGNAFADPVTVLPSFARLLTSSAPLIGLITAVQNGGWLLPQLFAANYVNHQERKKPYIIWPCVVGRPLFLVLAVVALAYGRTQPLLTLAMLYLIQALFSISDGLASVPWFDVLSKAIPGRRRGRYLATSQMVGGVLAVGAGVVVRRVLDPAVGLPFPQNYSLLFALAMVGYMISLLFLLLIKEPIESTHAERSSWGRYLPMLVTTLREDHLFRRIIATRLVAGLGGMATPFFILYGTQTLGLHAGIVGLCLTAQVIGRILGGGLLGVLIERVGNRFAILGGLSMVAMVPSLALLLGWWRSLLPDATPLVYVYPLLFFLLGLSLDSIMWGLTNFVLDIAPVQDRATYVGLTNTLTGLLVVAPILGGTILELTSYTVLFVVSLIIYACAILMARRLPVVKVTAPA